MNNLFYTCQCLSLLMMWQCPFLFSEALCLKGLTDSSSSDSSTGDDDSDLSEGTISSHMKFFIAYMLSHYCINTFPHTCLVCNYPK